MDYQNYEEYMRSVLGYSPMGNIYTDTYDSRNDYYYDVQDVMLNRNLDMYYPDIYKIVYPMVCKICNQNMNREITEDMIDSMTDEIYRNVEDVGTELSVQSNKTQLKNGDVKNPNVKESEIRETRQRNFLLRDLIRILILRELSRPNRPPFRPPVRPPRPPRPPRNPWGGMY